MAILGQESEVVRNTSKPCCYCKTGSVKVSRSPKTKVARWTLESGDGRGERTDSPTDLPHPNRTSIHTHSTRQYSVSFCERKDRHLPCQAYSDHPCDVSSVHLVTSQCLTAMLATLHLHLFPLFLLVLVSSPVHGQTQPSWDSRPVPSSVSEAGSVTLTCRFTNLGDSKIAWLKDNNNIFVDDDRWGAPDRFTVSRYEAGTVGGYDLTLTGATKLDDSDYTCQLQSGTLIATAHLTVLVPPDIPVISRNKTDALTEKDDVMFTCISQSGNPAPAMTWLRRTEGSGEWETLEGSVDTPPGVKFGSTRSTLTRVLERIDHKSQFKCSAINEASQGTPAQRIVTLDVRYAPIVSIRPADRTGSRLVVVSGSNVTLTCDVDANPLTSSRIWEKDGAQITVPDFRSVSKEDGGNYSCLATNVIQSTRARILLDVQYGPRVHVTATHLVNQTLTVPEGSPVNLTCQVDANPAVSTVQWVDSSDSVVRWGSSLVIDSVRRNKAGRLTCTSENILHPTSGPEQQKKGHQHVQLIVQYPPGKANITGPRYVLKGEEAVLICHVADKGVPEAAIEWTRLGDPSNTVISRQGELRFPSARLTNNADYICKPTNTINDGGPDTFRLVVNEPPEMTSGGELERRHVVNMTQLSPLSVQCQARGRPLPQVRWYKDERPIGNHDGLFMVETEHVAIDVHSFLVTTTLFWKGTSRDRLDRLRREDTGNYRCDFINEHGNTHSQMALTLQYMPILNITSDKVATDMNQSAVLSCSSQAVPVPRFEWYNGTTRLVNAGRVSISSDLVTGSFPYTSTLNISDVTMADLAEYKCVGINALGFAEKHIFLTVKTTPDAPSKLVIKSKTWESVELVWEAGFDGGYSQDFYVFYISSRQNNTRLHVLPRHSASFNVTDLFPSTTYTFKVFGENQLGGGEYSTNVSTVTPGHPIEPPIEVFYHIESRTLNFISPSTNYCVRIELLDDVRWSVYEECAPSTGSVKVHDDVSLSDVRIALCLQRRQAICSAKTKAFLVKPPMEDLSINTIVAVACVCGTVVLTLLIILIILCVRRYQAKKEYENDLSAPRPPANKKINGIDNPSLDQTDMVDMDPSSRQRRPNNANYNIGYDSKSDGTDVNGYPPMNGGPTWSGRASGTPTDPPPDYREIEKENRGHTESEYIAMHKSRKRQKSDGPDGHDSGYIPDHVKDNSDSGLSTPDPTKPKKVWSAVEGNSWSCGQLAMSNVHPVYNISGSVVTFSGYNSLPRHGINQARDLYPRHDYHGYASPKHDYHGYTSPQHHYHGYTRPGRSMTTPGMTMETPIRTMETPGMTMATPGMTQVRLGVSQQRPVSWCHPYLPPLDDHSYLPQIKDQPYLHHPTDHTYLPKPSDQPYLARPSDQPPPYQPQLRMADDSPYGYHGAPLSAKQNKSLPWRREGEKRREGDRRREGEKRREGDRRSSWRSSIQRSVSWTTRDVIRGSIHESLRITNNTETPQPLKITQNWEITQPMRITQSIQTPEGKIPSILDNYNTPRPDVIKTPPKVLPKPTTDPMKIMTNTGSRPSEPLRVEGGMANTSQPSRQEGNMANTPQSFTKRGTMASRPRQKSQSLRAPLPSDPREAISALIKEQKTGVSDEENPHNIKPSDMKKMMQKKRDRNKIPRQPCRPPSSVFRNEGTKLETDQMINEADNKLPPCYDSLIKEAPPKIFENPEENVILFCSVCEGRISIHPAVYVEAMTDFTSQDNSTVYKFKNLICDNCKGLSRTT